MKKSKDTLVGISVNKNKADKNFHIRDTVFKLGSRLNSIVVTAEKSKLGTVNHPIHK